MSETPVIRLVTPAVRAAEEQRAYEDAAHDESIAMLERTLAYLKQQRVSSVAVAFALADGAYGSSIPIAGGDRMGHLQGAIVDMQYKLSRNLNGDAE